MNQNIPILLVVDDRPDNLYVIEQVMGEYLPACTVYTAPNAETALRLAIEHHPDGILSDIQMPGTDGIQLCRQLKAHPETSHIPVVLMTAHTSEVNLRVEALDAGADDFIAKPIDNVELAARLKVMFRIKQAHDKLALAKLQLEEKVAERTFELQEKIKQLEQSEERLRTRESELIRMNSELERFTYTVSHDLKSPIITIKGFTGSLEKDLLNGNYQRMAEDLKRVSDAADKMVGLLHDLLGLSTIGRVISTPEMVDMNLLVDDVLAQLAGPLKSSNLTVAVQTGLPKVLCDRRRMAEVLQNLVENAINYSGDQPEPRIEIGVRQEAGENIFFVQDNGIGIDKKYHQLIFGLFNKLDANSQGTGVGLALVKRIIEVHGGRVWVESEGEGKGSRFCFELPLVTEGT
jgi:signal transduction histidine kinase